MKISLILTEQQNLIKLSNFWNKKLIKIKNKHPIIQRNTTTLELDYDWLKYDKLSHHQNEKQKMLTQLIKDEELRGEIFSKQKHNSSGSTKKQKVILLLLNELRYQLNKQCKERGIILTKLWNAYFKETYDEFTNKLKKRNKIVLSLLEELKNMKLSIDSKNLKIIENEENIVKLTEANKKLQNMLNDAKRIHQSQKLEISKLEQDKIDKDKELEFWLPCIFYYKDDQNIRNFIQSQYAERKLDEFTKDLSEMKLLIHGDICRLASVVSTKSEFQVKYEKLCMRYDELESDISKLRERNYFLTIHNEEMGEKLSEKDVIIMDLQQKLRDRESLKLEGIEHIRRISNLPSVSVQTDDDQEILDLIHNAKEQHKRWFMFSKNNSNKKIDTFQKLKRLKTFNQTGYVEGEINKIIK